MEGNTKLQDSIKSAKMLTGGVIKQGGQINHTKKALLKLFKSQKECFIKFEKTNENIFHKL